MSSVFEEMFGQVVGKGSQATVYARGESAVKLYREGYPKANVFSEAYIMAHLERSSFPSPRIHEVLLVNGRYGLRMDRVKGIMLSEDLQEPAKCKATMNVLVDLQCLLQKYDQVTWAPELKQRLSDDLVRNSRLSDDLRNRLLAALKRLPDGKALCHCDFHSGNVFFDGTNYTIIDLLQICRGDPAADAACTYAAYMLTNVDVAEFFLDRYSAASGISRERVRQWLTVYAGTLLGQIPEQFTPMIERLNAAEAITG